MLNTLSPSILLDKQKKRECDSNNLFHPSPAGAKELLRTLDMAFPWCSSGTSTWPVRTLQSVLPHVRLNILRFNMRWWPSNIDCTTRILSMKLQQKRECLKSNKQNETRAIVNFKIPWLTSSNNYSLIEHLDLQKDNPCYNYGQNFQSFLAEDYLLLGIPTLFNKQKTNIYIIKIDNQLSNTYIP